MTHLLGIDTGGTFTDAAVLESIGDAPPIVVAKAKSLTTRHDLAIGVDGAAAAALARAQCEPQSIGLVSLSTTLATNALVEGQGGRVALIAIGFEARDLEKAGLAQALGNDPCLIIPGGHTTHGSEAVPLDLSRLENEIDALAQEVSGFAIAGYFAVRNPAHEKTVRDFVSQRTGLPTTCSHELSARLNGPKRALTTVLNARLVPLISRLITSTRAMMRARKIDAPLMIVRGDGALVSAEFAMRRPIETILSGPAASLVGARFLTGCDDAFVNDIGGTTSDIALLNKGVPLLDPDGALVGGYRTMVEAVAMHTYGLGGDSEISLGGPALNPEIMLGPRRNIPLSLLALSHGELLHSALDKQIKATHFSHQHGRFALRSQAVEAVGLSPTEARMFGRLEDTPQALDSFLQGRSEAAVLDRLVARGLVQIAALTPSDALHALDRHGIWDKEAAMKGLALFARRKNGAGTALFDDPLKLADEIIRRMERRSSEIVLQTALNSEGRHGSDLVQHEIIRSVLDARQSPNLEKSYVQFSASLDRPLIGLGASAHAFHPNAAALLGVDALIPEHADVANAIGAVVGRVSLRTQLTVSQPVEGRFQISGFDDAFANAESAIEFANEKISSQATLLAEEAGAVEFEIHLTHEEKRAEVESRSMFIECTIVATVTGRPPIGH